MPITPSGSEQPELENDVRQACTQVGVVTRMAGFHCVQALVLETFDTAAGASFFQMRDRDEPANRMHQFDNSTERRQRFLDESRAMPPKITVESISQIARAAMPDDSSGYMRPAHRCPIRFAQHVVKRDAYPQTLKVRYHRPSPTHTVSSTTLQKAIQSC